MPDYLNYLEESTNVVKSKDKLSKLLIIITYLAVWSVSLIVFWFFVDGSDAMGYSIMFEVILLPVTTFVLSILIGKNNYWGKWKWLSVIILGIMYMLAHYASFGAAHMASEGSIDIPNFGLIPIGAFVALVGLGLGIGMYRYSNILNRNFAAERPNQKWVTDISYIRTGQGFLYLSIIRDLYDNSIIAYKTGTEQNIRLVLNTIKAAKRKEKVTAELHLHSDQGFQYTSQAYFKLTQQYGITPSMSRRGNPYDNALAENFFSILKTECIHRVKIKTFAEARRIIDEYIYFYNHQRIQTKTKLTPMEFRCQYVA